MQLHVIYYSYPNMYAIFYITFMKIANANHEKCYEFDQQKLFEGFFMEKIRIVKMKQGLTKNR